MVAIGCLPFVRINRLGRPLNNGKGLFQNQQTTERNGAYHLQFDFPELFSADERLKTGKFSKCGGSPKFPNGFSGKLLFGNFRIFSAKCKPGEGGSSIYPWVGRCGPTPYPDPV